MPLVVGATARLRGVSLEEWSPREAAARVLETASQGREVAVEITPELLAAMDELYTTLRALVPTGRVREGYQVDWITAAKALCKLGHDECLPLLIERLRDEKARSNWRWIASNLGTLTGQSLPPTYEAWHQWWEERGQKPAPPQQP